MGYILRNEDVLRYYQPSIGNLCLLRTAFDVSGDDDLTRFKTEFDCGNWLELMYHLNLRPNTKSVVECAFSINFYVYLVAGIHQFVGTPPTTFPDFFKEIQSLFTLVANCCRKKIWWQPVFFQECDLCTRISEIAEKFEITKHQSCKC